MFMGTDVPLVDNGMNTLLLYLFEVIVIECAYENVLNSFTIHVDTKHICIVLASINK